MADRTGRRQETEVSYYEAAGFADPEGTTDRPTFGDDYSWGVAPYQYRTQQILEIPKARLSISAGFGTVMSVAGLVAAASGLLAPEGLVIALIGSAFCVVGLAAGGEDGITGRGLAMFGLLCGLAGMVIAVVALTHRYYWPNSDVDEVAALHTWIITHWSWLGL